MRATSTELPRNDTASTAYGSQGARLNSAPPAAVRRTAGSTVWAPSSRPFAADSRSGSRPTRDGIDAWAALSKSVWPTPSRKAPAASSGMLAQPASIATASAGQHRGPAQVDRPHHPAPVQPVHQRAADQADQQPRGERGGADHADQQRVAGQRGGEQRPGGQGDPVAERGHRRGGPQLAEVAPEPDRHRRTSGAGVAVGSGAAAGSAVVLGSRGRGRLRRHRRLGPEEGHGERVRGLLGRRLRPELLDQRGQPVAELGGPRRVQPGPGDGHHVRRRRLGGPPAPPRRRRCAAASGRR